jgi:hypothetical protein
LLARISEAKRIKPENEAKKVEVVVSKRVRQEKWDRYMRRFEFGKALDVVLTV